METLLKRWIGKPVRVVRKDQRNVLYNTGILEEVSSRALMLSSTGTGWVSNDASLRKVVYNNVDKGIHSTAHDVVIPFDDVINVSLLEWLDATKYS